MVTIEETKALLKSVKNERRDEKNFNAKNRWVKHGEGKWTPKAGQSKFINNHNKQKIKLTGNVLFTYTKK